MKYSVYCKAISHALHVLLNINDNLFCRFSLVHDLSVISIICVSLYDFITPDFNSPLTALTGYRSPFDSDRRI